MEHNFVAVEEIRIQDKKVTTLKELLRPQLRVVFVGINPTPKSVSRGHYYQGKLGKRFWNRLQTYGFTSYLPEGEEDEMAFSEGFGFADLVRKPTSSADDLSTEELHEGASDLLERLLNLGTPRPVIVFVFKKAFDYSATTLRNKGFQVYRMPGPYSKKADERKIMLDLRGRIAS